MQEKVVSLYQSEKKIYPREILGFYAKWRWFFVWITQIIFYFTPWIEWGGRQAVLFEITSRKFYIFKYVFYPQDLIYLSGILIISALGLFLFTTLAGRIWCGLSCPQTVYTEIFLWIEAKIEGNFIKRERRDKSNWNINKIFIKLQKHIVWIIFSIWTGFTFVGFFTPIKPLLNESIEFSVTGWSLFWIIFYGFLTYFNAGFMREQVCKYMCPYARFQSSMFDQNTLTMIYDKDRGEPRKGKSDGKQGDCIDCNICVQVCPNGIDIRNGLQYECIFCGLCADACDSVMKKVNKPGNLISYTTPIILKNNLSFSKKMKIFLRPRITIYSLILISIIGLFFYKLENRYDFKFNVIRDRGILSRVDKNDMLQNVYRLKIMNVGLSNDRYNLAVDGLPRIRIDKKTIKNLRIELDPVESDTYVVTVEIPNKSKQPGNYPINFLLRKLGSDNVLFEKSIFVVPKDENKKK